MLPPIQPLAAGRAQPGAVGSAQREERLGERQLVVEDGVQLDLMVLIDPRDIGVLRLGLDRRAGDRVDARQELFVDRDPNVLDERIGAA